MWRSRSGTAIDISNNREIILALRSGNEAIFDAVYRFYFGRLLLFGTRYMASEPEVEEVVQDTMLWLWENKHTLIEDCSLKSLLFTIVKNKLLNRLARAEVKGRVVDEIEQKYTALFNDPDSVLQNKELMRCYQRAISSMPKEHRQAFEMNRNGQLTHKEIALKLGVSNQTVNYRISQALKFLRSQLKDFFPLIFCGIYAL